MYSLGMPVSQLRTKMRQEFERHRYVTQISVVDMLLFQSHAEYQVRGFLSAFYWEIRAKARSGRIRFDIPFGTLRRREKHLEKKDVFLILVVADCLTSQETLNYWKQLPHILKYFRAEEDPNARRPQNFMSGFLEV